MNVIDTYSELVALTKLLLLREFHGDDAIISDPKTCHHFSRLIKKPVKKTQPEPSKTTFSKPQSPPPPKPTASPPQAKIELPPQPPQFLPRPPAPPVQKISMPIASPKEEKSAFTLEPFPASLSANFDECKHLFKKLFPQLTIHDILPSDQHAKVIKHRWKQQHEIPPIVLLSFNEQEKQLAFLNNVAQAITRDLAPAKVISGLRYEQEKKWDSVLNATSLQMIIASDYSLYLLPNLMKFYKENTQAAKHYLNNTPLLLLSDLSLYLKEPQLKPLLWRAICKEYENTTNK